MPTTTVITLEPCALNAEFQHFILRFHTLWQSFYFQLCESVGVAIVTCMFQLTLQWSQGILFTKSDINF